MFYRKLDRKTIENLYWLYNNPRKLSFASDAEERKFWRLEEVSHRVGESRDSRAIDHGMSDAEILSAIRSGKVDFVVEEDPGDPVEPGKRCYGYRLNPEFAKNSKRVRALSERMWLKKLPKKYKEAA